MKKILTVILAGVCTLAFAQKRIDLSRSIDDDGERLSIKVNGTIDGKRIDYDRTFKVGDLSKKERNALAEHVLDSLGAGTIASSVMPTPPTPPQAPSAQQAPSILFADDSGQFSGVTNHQREGRTTFLVGGDKPFTKELKYNPESGQMFMRYRFNKNDEEYTYEKTLNVLDKSEEERQRIITDFEKEIELPGRGN